MRLDGIGPDRKMLICPKVAETGYDWTTLEAATPQIEVVPSMLLLYAVHIPLVLKVWVTNVLVLLVKLLIMVEASYAYCDVPVLHYLTLSGQASLQAPSYTLHVGRY